MTTTLTDVKYEVSVSKNGDCWLAIMICHCGKTLEKRALEGDDLQALLHNVGTTLAEHEEREK